MFFYFLVFDGLHSQCLTDMAKRIQLITDFMRTNRLHLTSASMSDITHQVEMIYNMASGRKEAFGTKYERKQGVLLYYL